MPAKLTIIGLTQDQQVRISNEFEERFELTFVSSEKSQFRKAATAAENAESVVLMTKFVSHDMQNAVRHHPGLVYVNGGLSSLRERLSSFSTAEPTPVAKYLGNT